MKKKALIGLIAGLLLLLVIVVALPRRGASGTVRIGSILVLSGDYKSMGEQIRDGQTLAIDEINTTPGQKHKFSLVVYDSQGEKDVSLEKVKTFHRDGVNFIGEIFGSGPALHCIPYVTEQNMLFLSGVDTGPDLTEKGGRNFFRIIQSDAVAARQLARWALDLGLKRAAVVYLNDTWGTGLKRELDRVYPAAGGEIVLEQETGQGQDIFRPVVAALKSKQPQAVFLFMHPSEAAVLLREARLARLAGRFFGTDNLTGSELLEVGRDAVEGVMYVAPRPAEQTRRSTQFLEAYQRKYGAGRQPPLFTMMGYDAIHVLSRAIGDSGADVNRAISELEKMRFEGASGTLSFDKNHDVVVRDYQRMEYVRQPSGITAREYSAATQAR